MLNLSKEEKLKRVGKAVKAYNEEAEKKGLKSRAGLAKDMPDFGKIELIKTGLYKFDKYVGGIPKGRYTQIYGPASAGKSTLIETIAGSMQKNNMVVALANNERNYEAKWAAKQGLNVDELIGGNFSDLEECLNFTIDMAETDGACDALIVDTITAISSKQEQTNKKKKDTRDLDDDTMALIARKLSQFFRMATTKVDDSKMACILVNQVRSNIGSYGGGLEAGGGNALKHNKSLDLFVTRAQAEKEAFKTTHFMVNVKIVKSKIMEAPENTKFSMYFKIGEGFDNALDIIIDGIDSNLITKDKTSYIYEDLKVVGLNKFIEEIKTKPKLLKDLESKLIKVNINESEDTEDKPEEEV